MSIIPMKFHPHANLFPLMNGDELTALADDIKTNGLLEPIMTDNVGYILDGRNRYHACLKNGVEPTYTIFEGDSVLDYVISKNLHRRHLNESQRAMLGVELIPLFEKEARERMFSGKKTDPGANLPDPNKGRAREKAAKAVKVSPRSVESAKKVKRGTPELIQAVRDDVIPVSAASSIVDRPPEEQTKIVNLIKTGESKNVIHAKRQVDRENMKTVETPKGKYRVLYADPPWDYGGNGLDNYGPSKRHYPDMSMEELCNLPIKDITDDNAVLFLWVTAPFLKKCFPMITAWGFEYKTFFVWDKVKHNFGYYNSVRHECLLVCTHGSCLPDIDTKFDSVISIEKTRKHSEKPERFRELIDQLYPHGSRIELFARTQADGWETWGNQVE